MNTLSEQNFDRLNSLATDAARSLDLVILRITARGVPSRPVIEVVLDGPRLVSLSDCEAVSRKLNDAVESEKLAGGNYRLDVLSPGLDEPIVHDYQFQRTIGHFVEVRRGTPPVPVSGILKSFSPEEIILAKRQKKKGAAEEEIHIKRDEIESAFARADFGL